jgi:hypothetical protein
MRNRKRATVQYRRPTNNQVEAAQYNYRTATGEKQKRTKEEARGYIEGYTDGLNDDTKKKKTRAPRETAKLMEKRYNEDRGGEDRTRYDQQGYN